MRPVLFRPFHSFPLMLAVCAAALVVPGARAQDAAPGALLEDIRTMSRHALDVSRSAEQAATVADVKTAADDVFALIWGMPSGLLAHHGAAAMHGWKTRWQVDGSEFDEAFIGRYGTQAPAVTDPNQLGIIGRGLAVRASLEALENDADADASARRHAGHVITSLNNVIGWMKIDDGVTKGERQPRIDLTRQWDAPAAFWLSTADTGWLYEAYAQALNILKTSYGDDVGMAREHAAGLSRLLEKALTGVDADHDGTIAPIMMEGGLETAFQHAGFGGFLAP